MILFFIYIIVGIVFSFIGNYYVLVAEDKKQSNKRVTIFYLFLFLYLIGFIFI